MSYLITTLEFPKLAVTVSNQIQQLPLRNSLRNQGKQGVPREAKSLKNVLSSPLIPPIQGFNPSLDPDLTLIGPKALQLEQRRAQLANSEHVIRSYPERLAQLELQEQALAHRTSPGASYLQCVDWLYGTQQQQGRLPWLQAQLDAVPPLVHNVTQARLNELLDTTYRNDALWKEVTAQLAARSAEVSYAQLYQAVLALAEGATECPACGTNLNAAVQNPFTKARIGLQQLAELAAIQQREAELRTQLGNSVRFLWEEMRRLIAIAQAQYSQALQAANLPALPPDHIGNWLGAWVDNDRRGWMTLLSITTLIENADIQSRAIHAQRGELAQERDRLTECSREIERLRAIRNLAQSDLALAQQTVVQFDEVNRALIAEVAAEVNTVAHHTRVKVAYDAFLPELQAYLAALPGLLLEGLGEQAKNLYNSFNRGDPPSDHLHALRLPLAENGKIEIEFAGELGVWYDALIVFSEGHIKCLGLAILLAKNIAQGCPVVIFDDVVNAIDDEHRDGIWRTFFEDGLLDEKQIILTSHAEEFLLRIQQEIGAHRAEAIKRYKFLPHLGEHELRIDGDPPTKNYVLLAQQALAADEKRDALRHARPALESLTDRLWTWLGRRTDGHIDLKLAGPRSPWELNNKCTKLRAAVARIAPQYVGAPDAVAR